MWKDLGFLWFGLADLKLDKIQANRKRLIRLKIVNKKVTAKRKIMKQPQSPIVNQIFHTVYGSEILLSS